MTSKILIVDDDPLAFITMESIFDGQPYQLIPAYNGSSALEKAGEIMPDLILLDVMMPDMDGFEICRRIRSTPRLAEVPIIILTSLDDRSSRLLGIEAGADDFISKPPSASAYHPAAKSVSHPAYPARESASHGQPCHPRPGGRAQAAFT